MQNTYKGRGAKYAAPIALSLVGGFLIFLPSLLSAPSYMALKSSETLTRVKLRERAKTAEVGRETNLAPQKFNRSMFFRDYINQGEDPTQLLDHVIPHYLSTDVVRVHDQTQTCLGVIKNKQFIWVGNDPEVCK